MTRTPFHFAQVIAFCAPLALVTSCGKGTEAVQGTTVLINPDAWGQQTNSLNPTCHKVLYFQVSAISPTGYPQIGAAFQIDSPNAFEIYDGWVPTSAIIPFGTCGETVDKTKFAPLVQPFTATADNSGNYRLTVDYSWTGGVKAVATAVEAFSGTGYGKTDITFTCTDGNAVGTAPDCPQ